MLVWKPSPFNCLPVDQRWKKITDAGSRATMPVVLTYDKTNGWRGFYAVDEIETDLPPTQACILTRMDGGGIVAINDLRNAWGGSISEIPHAS